MTERLYYTDSYLRSFDARVVEAVDDGRRVYLDRTALYPESGGQPSDAGTLNGVRIVEIVDEDDRIAHVLGQALSTSEVRGEVDWTRRYDHMQQHTGQHLLSSVLEELFGFKTLSFHMGPEVSTIELATTTLTPKQIEQTERRCAEVAASGVAVSVALEDAVAVEGLRKPSQRTGTLRIVSIGEQDRSACGGTHVRTSAEVAPILIRKLDKVRGNARIEFVCGWRALRRAKLDFDAVSEAGRALSVGVDQVASSIASVVARATELEKELQKTTTELARREGRDLFANATPTGDGLRRVSLEGELDDAMKARANGFVAGGKAIFTATSTSKRSVMLAASTDANVHAGNVVKELVTALGGRGGGNQGMAQGSVAADEAFAEVVNRIGKLLL